MNKTRKLIQIAEEKLTKHPFDIGHDVYHHFCVWKNAYVIKTLENLNVNTNYLDISCWWHDYERGSKEHLTLTKEMENLNFTNEEISNVVDIINAHSFSDKKSQKVEAKILFDADKIEYVNPARYFWIGEGSRDGLIGEKSARKYGKALTERLPQIITRFSYDTSRKLFAENLSTLIRLLTAMKEEYKEFLVDVDMQVLEKAYKDLEK